MFRKVAVALFAASMFTAPVFAQGTAGSATAPAKAIAGAPAKTAGTPAASTAAPAAKVMAPTVKKAKIGKRHVRHHVWHVSHRHHGKPLAVHASVKMAPKAGTH
jgi:hypothetical protein